jgi:glycerol-3-phosphate dehydrogenase
MIERMGLTLAAPGDADPPRMPYIGAAGTRPYADAERIAADPAYGELVCFCERVSRGEIRDALASDIPPRTVEGLLRRTRATMGRCQGFYCGAEVRALLDRTGAVS